MVDRVLDEELVVLKVLVELNELLVVDDVLLVVELEL